MEKLTRLKKDKDGNVTVTTYDVPEFYISYNFKVTSTNDYTNMIPKAATVEPSL